MYRAACAASVSAASVTQGLLSNSNVSDVLTFSSLKHPLFSLVYCRRFCLDRCDGEWSQIEKRYRVYLNADLEITDAEKGIWIVFNHTFGKKNAGIKGLKSVQKGMYESL